MKKKAYMAPATNFIQADLQQIMSGSKIVSGTSGDAGIDPANPNDPVPETADARQTMWDDDEDED